MMQWVNLGIYLTMKKRCDEAKKTLEHAQKLVPQIGNVQKITMLWNPD
ncbi:MAG: hypothetical protein OEV85_08195 [Candidatus Thorarchaeota archaeon]|nr:hypothetical protein [Candidatus Thorarchaeota archaeon]